MDSDTGAEPPSPTIRPVEPVPALPYRSDQESGWRVEPRFVVAAAMAAGVLGVLSFAVSAWICFWPGLFRTVGAYSSFGSVAFALSLAQLVPQLAVIAGCAAFLARRPIARPLLRVGSAGVLLLQVVTFIYYTFAYRRVPSAATPADMVVLSVWQGGAVLNASVAPVLILLMMARPRFTVRPSSAAR